MKKLYLISYYFAPLGRADGVNRTYLVKYLAEAGWDIDVISCANPHGFIRSFQKDPSLLDVIPPQVKLHPIESNYWGPLGGIAELMGVIDDSFSNWIHPTIHAANTIIHDSGLIYAIVPPITNAKIAAHLAKERGMPFVIDFRDNEFNLPPSLVQDAMTIIASTDMSLLNMQQHYGLNSRLGKVIYNGYATDQLPDMPTRQRKANELKIIYTGLLNLDLDPAMLAKAIHHLEWKYPHTKGKVSVDYYGPKNFYTRYFLHRYLSNNVRFGGYLPFQEVLTQIAQSDLAYVSVKGKKDAYRIPSKIFQYLAMETPILATGPTGALQSLIAEHRLGRFAVSDDIDAQAEDIYFFLQNHEARQAIAETLRERKKHFSMQVQAQKLSEYLLSLVKNMGKPE